MASTRAGEDGGKKRRGRPPGSRNSVVSKGRVAKPVPAVKKSRKNKSGKRSRQEDEEDELSVLSPTTQAHSSRPQERKTHAETDQPIKTRTKVQKTYAQLETKTKRISQDVIETWPHLPQQVLEQVVAVIKDAKKDIANTQRDERKVMAAHNTLNPLVKRLVRQLAASKIPPQARDIHFNVDKLTERNGQVFRDLTTARHSKQLLAEQVKVVKHLLYKDERSLDQLKKDAKEWKVEWKRQRGHGRIHPLLQSVGDTDIDGDSPEDVHSRSSAAPDTSSLDAPDAELAPILEQLRRSLENMQGNHTQVEDVDRAMVDAQTALDDVLFRHASAHYAAL